ncbi:MAG: hydrolase, partial [Flavobacterium sp.]|nr:hydrolase [Flavobacterium sp.]
FMYNFYPGKGIINRHSLNLMALMFWRPNMDFKKTDHTYMFFWDAEFKDQSTLRLALANQYIFLMRDFDPTRTVGGTPLPGNKEYSFNQFTATYQSNMAKKFTFNATSTAGQFFNGHDYSVGGQLSLRIQPWALMSLALNYDGIRLPDPHPDADLWLVSPKVDITFSKSLYWGTLVQYSNQRDNLGINSRLQWRFAPLSDLYLVYNDNYNTDNFTPRFRSINLKLTYWLNI